MQDTNTRLKLILAAERLFAEKGLQAVSLRQINLAAGQRNASALHYHFGTRDALIEAVFAYRMGEIDRRRCRMVDEVMAAGRQDDMYAIVETFVLPLVEELRPRPEGNYYVRLLAQMYSDPTIDFRAVVDGKYNTGVRRGGQLALAIRADLPREIMTQRLLLVRQQVVQALSEAEMQLQYDPDRLPPARLDCLVWNLIDVVTGALLAPMSATSHQLHRDAGRRRA